MSRAPRAFVSYSRRDKQNPLLRALVRDLSSLFGIDVWMDVDEIQVGDSILEKITDGIHRSDFFLLIISAHSSVQLWPRQEFELAYSSQLNERRAKILPIKVDDGPT
ncbi:MAG TPA: toll/interleukin-1 receptor domain-containing protein, partial [Gammaproteobacteria bacterium]|nr:toll/interleukin-1 receptor domain-containing protein [Gammaproteobacteria bacterium]